MLCSISTAKSGSKWLDRLRSTKGFLSGDDDDHLNLEQFLTDQNPNFSNSSSIEKSELRSDVTGTESNSKSVQIERESVFHLNETSKAAPERNKDEELCNVVSNVLSELFNMGESTNLPKFHAQKGLRKQINPRFCAPAGGSARRKGETASSPSDDNSRVEMKESKVKLLEQEQDLNVGEEEEDKWHSNLSGFSRSEIMVIDTSCAPWKSEKLLFRKKNVWKVRSKKSKATNLGKKKRKADVADRSVGGEKKQKVSSGKECNLQVNEKHTSSDKLEDICKRTPDVVGQVSKKKQGNLTLKKASSSVFLIKSIPTSKKNGTGITKNCPKSFQRQPKAQ